MISRRRFLAASGGIVAVRVIAGCSPGTSDADVRGASPVSTTGPPTSPAATTVAAAAPTTTAAAAPAAPLTGGRRVLVVVQLGGGNDALNTLVPLDGRYHDARPGLAVPAEGLVAVPGTGAYGLHPALGPLAPMVAAGQVAVVAAVGYPDADRSHFAALDSWWTATPGQASATGWLGRALDATATAEAVPLRAVALGGGSPALAATRVRPTVVQAPEGFVVQAPRGVDEARLVAAWRTASRRAGSGLDAEAGAATLDALAAVEVFASLDADARAESGDSPEQGDRGQQISRALGTAAELIVADRGTEVVYVSAGGFDTHAAQAATHERLLADLAAGIAGFYATLGQHGQSDRVVLMTVSEFGRRVAENGSGGTDHGKAGVQFVVGPAVRGGLVGDLDLARLDDGDLAPSIDVRSLYHDGLAWLGVPVEEVLTGGSPALAVVGG